ncbi:hypothetical protein QMP26_41060 (plasmid) [Enterocloster clostridioformis]
MNINRDRKNAIIALYNKGISIEDIQLVSGFSRKTIEEIVEPKGRKSVDDLVNEIFKLLETAKA